MREVVLVGSVALLLASCGQRSGSIKHTSFFDTHDPVAHLESVAKAEGYETGAATSGLSIGGPVGERDYQFSFKGDDKIRDKVLKDYKDFVERGLKQSGASISGWGVAGDVTGFDFNYENGGVTGIMRVKAVVGAEGFVEVDVFAYEHPSPR